MNGGIGTIPICEIAIDPNQMVSYYDHLFGVIRNLGPVVRYSYGSAKGDARFFGTSASYEIRVVGKYKDVRVVINKFEDVFGAKDLNPKLGLPDLPDWVARLKYLINWVKTGQK